MKSMSDIILMVFVNGSTILWEFIIMLGEYIEDMVGVIMYSRGGFRFHDHRTHLSYVDWIIPF